MVLYFEANSFVLEKELLNAGLATEYFYTVIFKLKIWTLEHSDITNLCFLVSLCLCLLVSYGELRWLDVAGCQGIQQLQCDLSDVTSAPREWYYARVHASALPSSKSAWALSPRFSPRWDSECFCTSSCACSLFLSILTSLPIPCNYTQNNTQLQKN